MSDLYKSNHKATVCTKNVCVTVYDNAAKIIEGIVIATVAFLAITIISKALR